MSENISVKNYRLNSSNNLYNEKACSNIWFEGSNFVSMIFDDNKHLPILLFFLYDKVKPFGF